MGGAIVGIVAIVLGIVALVRKQSKGFAITGIVLGAVAFIVSVVMAVFTWWVATNPDTVQRIVDQAVETPAPSVAPVESATPAPVDPAIEFATLDDAAFAAIVASPDDHVGENVLLYGEVQQLLDDTGCTFLAIVDPVQQTTWEGYEVTAVAFALSSEEPGTTCAETAGVAELSHVALSATVLGLTPIEYDDGTTEDTLSLDVHRVEGLPDLP